MKKLSVEEMKSTNGGALALIAIWTGICGLFCWGMGKLGDKALKSVRRK